MINELPGFIRFASPTETVYINLGSSVISRSRIDGKITPQALSMAQKFIEAKYQALRARIILIGDRFAFVEKQSKSPIKLLQNENADSIYSRLLNFKLDIANELYKIYIIERPFDFDIFILSSHTIADAQSLIVIHSELIKYLDCALDNIIPNIIGQAFLKDIDSLINDYLIQTDNSTTTNKSFPTVINPGDFIRLPIEKDDCANLEQGFVQLIIPEIEMRQIIDACRTHYVTVNSLLIAVFASAIIALAPSGGNKIMMRSSANLRRRINPNIADDLILTAATAFTICLDAKIKGIWKLAAKVNTEVINVANSINLVVEHLEYPKRFDVAKQPLWAAINISNFGVVESVATSKLRQITFDYVMGWKNDFPNVSIATTNGILVANLAFRRRVLLPETAEELMRRVYHNLLEAAR